MGLRLPIYPYYAAQGKTGVKFEPTSFHNQTAFDEMQHFEDYLSEPVIRKVAFNIIPPAGSLSAPAKGWFKPAAFDRDDTDHTGLADLMAKVGKHGTILVPDVTHIIGKEEDRPPSRATRELMTRFDSEDIEVLPLVLKLRTRRYDLTKFPEFFARNHTPSPEIFELMPEIARATVDYLQRAVGSGNGLRHSPSRR